MQCSRYCESGRPVLAFMGFPLLWGREKNTRIIPCSGTCYGEKRNRNGRERGGGGGRGEYFDRTDCDNIWLGIWVKMYSRKGENPTQTRSRFNMWKRKECGSEWPGREARDQRWQAVTGGCISWKILLIFSPKCDGILKGFEEGTWYYVFML